ncbi:hypothetical protein BVRB_9g209150 [Beta vulgaris subsp. vulgaris]|nr:hypothetical protein BVRB_9g209150 [Beta vulgaris subsp. vulgaris]
MDSPTMKFIWKVILSFSDFRGLSYHGALRELGIYSLSSIIFGKKELGRFLTKK